MELPHAPRVAGVAFLLYLALGHLPALFALPAGLGDIAAGIAAPLVALRLARGTGRRAAVWFNTFGLTDLLVALTLGALTGFQLLNVTPSSAPITELPLALIPTATVPLLFALHIMSMSRSPEPHDQRRQPPARSFPAPRCALPVGGPSRARANAPRCTAASSWPPSPTSRAIRPHDCTPGVSPVNGKETQ